MWAERARDLPARGALQFDLWEPSDEIPVGHGQTRKRYVVVACPGYSRGACALIFSKQIPDVLFGIRSSLWSLGAPTRASARRCAAAPSID